jgi:hypothetical protein
VGVATRMSERERELHMWCARSEPDEGRCPYDRRRARSECGLCVSVLVVSAAWPHGCEGCVLPEMGNSVGACQLGYCVRCVACHVCVSAATANSALGGMRGAARAARGVGVGRGRWWTRRQGGEGEPPNGSATGERPVSARHTVQPRYKTRQISRVSSVTQHRG